MTLPGHIVQQIHQHYQATGWAVITLNKKDQVISLNQTACELLGNTEVALTSGKRPAAVGR